MGIKNRFNGRRRRLTKRLVILILMLASLVGAIYTIGAVNNADISLNEPAPFPRDMGDG